MSVRRSTTSNSMPSLASSSAASSARWTIAPYVMTETSEPARFTSALPIGTMKSSAERCADHQGHRRSPAIVVLRRQLGDLVEGAGDEVGELHLDHRAHPHHGRADGSAHEPGLGQRRVQHPPLAVLLLEPLRDPEGPAVRADVLAHQKYPFVAGHFFIERLRDRLEVGNLPSCRGRGHGLISSSVANTPFNVSGPSGRGLFSANSTPASTSFVTRSPTSRKVFSSAQPSCLSICSAFRIGSFFFHSSKSSRGTYLAESCSEWPCMRIVLHSMKVGPSPARAFWMARRAAR